MTVIILCFVLGIVVGRLLRSRQRWIRFADRLTMWTVYALLLVLGLSVGGNREVLADFGPLGLQAGVLTAGAIAGSVAAVQLLSLWPSHHSR
jgi:uncharacterized membrane protein YbjE (DUF340 family)